jgi:hypothetical protein
MKTPPPPYKSPRGSFWWKYILKHFPKFREFAVGKPGKGNSTTLWSDNLSGQLLEPVFPRLHSFYRKKHWSLKYFVEKDLGTTLFLPLSEIATDQLSKSDVLVTDKIEDLEADDS